ncbi:type IV conjugative transfer system protein TraE [Chromobacterium sp. IIBBL 290-4]|uniref:type IV conjugative transfer system protein TraE n=1 Tax=Chromobacterium sp. IIBBL 290-4 TaxID=2953890 RepID=UPI0020B89F6F|nr:type IV conjugative transfer system protein TraE [Chromobacterium sp. IIBBL 290-4]UTH74242.1 type IV conjugative transfer system protein TraE [Chromobacterium sp. IIBBL 290-4]
MKWSDLRSSWDRTIASNRLLAWSNFLLAICLAGLVVKLIDSRERLVLVPPHMDKQLELSWDEANADYYKGFGLYVATLVANVTPKTVEFVKAMLGTLMSREVYGPVRIQLTAMADDPIFQRGTNITFFTPSQVSYEVESRKVFVVGSLVTSAQSNVEFGKSVASTDMQSVVYEFRFEMANGRPLITAFNSYKGTTPRTAKWYRQNQLRPGDPIPEHLSNPKPSGEGMPNGVDRPIISKE